MTVVAVNPNFSLDPRVANAVFTRTFDGRKGVDFSAYNDAVDFLRGRGFSVGTRCIARQIGVMYGRDWQIAKWRNLTAQERTELHGVLIGERRLGSVRVAIFWNAPAFAIAAVAEPHVADRIVSTWAAQR